MKNYILKIFILLLVVGFVSMAQTEEPLIKTFPASPGENLQLSVDPGNIQVETWNKNEVKIEVTSRKKYKIENLVAEKSGNTIKFELELDHGWNNSVKVKVNAPSKFNFDMETTGGNISIEESITGKLTAETDGGNVSFEDVNGVVSVNTSGGNISGENVEGDVTLHTNGGNISLGNVKVGKSDIETNGGNISVGNVASDLQAKTYGGSISVGNVGGSANVLTYGGHISMEKVSGAANMETYGGHISLDGASGDVVAKTMGGHINLENITGSIEATTQGGNISAELDPKLNTNSILSTGGGKVELKIPSTAKSTIEVYVENDDIEYDDPKKIVRSDFPSSKFDVNKDDGEINATYVLNGGGSKISLKCEGGEVRIKKWNK